jgi:DNA-binding NarL/FixJ family response regulator
MTDPWNLSDMESKCLRLMADGWTIQKVMEDLGLSEKAVQSYLFRAKRKMSPDPEHVITLCHACVLLGRHCGKKP